MKVLIVCFVLIAIVLLSTSAKAEIPTCLQKKIASILAGPVLNPPASISKYLYRGKLVYLWISSCCDQFNPLYDGECNRICAPSGGKTGRGDGQCADFRQTATLLENLWVDPRSHSK
ncbi:unnamed protein product [Rotaria sp. Silwood1]|nr:unnamed protein product [Rotaria sp. Silwood1]CAF1562763.1 unnamed protein product [Rotaria sp. Silwood1]CAF1564161.1 unnamed protein product [Rotaria sp. Silwood1]CAF3682922.1 unnamed protein product [Rotaria sp. Silwood1]CAF3689441.1 unnamed protein product [Rotaria sp. Silwood1]